MKKTEGMKKSLHRCHRTTLSSSPLRTLPFIKWLRTRYNNENRRNPTYLYSPRQLKEEQEIEKIFTEFDSDGSGGLSRLEIYNMFQGFNIDMPLEKLDELYNSVEANLKELNLEKFKQCALSSKSNQVFKDIVNQLQQKNTSYLPKQFMEMITYLVYLTKRDELVKKIRDRRVIGQDRIDSMSHLLQLSQLSDNNKQINMQRQNLRKHMDNKVNKMWQQLCKQLSIDEQVPLDYETLMSIREQCKKHQLSSSRH